MIHRKCTRFSLGENHITAQNIWTIADASCINTRIHSFSILGKHVSDTDVQYMAQTLSVHNWTLRSLTLFSSGITDVHASLLDEVLMTNRTRIHLDLSRNLIGDQGLIQLVNILIQNNNKFGWLMVQANK
jgi:hypothetical protein